MKLTRHLAGYLPANLASAIASFGGVYVFTRLLDADEYGRYALMFSVMALIHTVTLAPAEAAAYRFTGEANASGKLSLIHISEPTRPEPISYAVFCLKKKK